MESLHTVGVWAIGFGTFLAGSAVFFTKIAYGLDMITKEIRGRTFVFMWNTSNVGLALGALISGIALAIGTRDAIMAMPLISGAVMVLNAFFVQRLPRDTRVRHSVLEPALETRAAAAARCVLRSLGVRSSIAGMAGPAAFIWLVAGRSGSGRLIIGFFLLLMGAVSPALVKWAKNDRQATLAVSPAPSVRIADQDPTSVV